MNFEEINTIISERGVWSYEILGENYAANLQIINVNSLVVFTFDNAGSAAPFGEEKLNRDGWGVKYLCNKKINVVGFLAKNSANWYRSDEFVHIASEVSSIIDELNINNRIAYGGSMGGYAACAYSDLLKVKTVIAFNPISTLNRQACNWEYRYTKPSFINDWLGKYSDSIDGIKNISSLNLIYDPLFMPDRNHAKRLVCSLGSSIVCNEIKFRGVGHKMPKHFQNLGLLNTLIESLLYSDYEDKSILQELKVKKRDYLRYYDWLLSLENSHSSYKRNLVVWRYRNKYLVRNGIDPKGFFNLLVVLFLSLKFIKCINSWCRKGKVFIGSVIFIER